MRKASLKRKTGCLRCKRRHKRCDELKPKCSYCARWQLECLWPENNSPETEPRATISSQHSDEPDTFDPEVTGVQYTSPVNATGSASGLHPLHNFHQRNTGGTATGLDWVQEFLVTNPDTSNGYNVTDLHSEIVHGWPGFPFVDKNACAAQIASWAAASAQRRRVSVGVITGLEFETLTISRLRRAISSGAPVSEETLLAVVAYFIISVADLLDRSQLRNLVQGINVMVMSFGGIDTVLQKMKATTVLAVLHCDILGSLLNAERHFFIQLEKPKRLQSLTDRYQAQHNNTGISRYIAADVAELFTDLGLLSYFQQPLTQSQGLTAYESHYLLLLDQWIGYRLGVLQASHINDRSLSELFIVALIILKQEIIADTPQHPVLGSTLLTRLQTSISQFQIQASLSRPASEPLHTIITWISLIALAGMPLTLQRLWFADYIHNSLTRRYGPIQAWPDSWDEDLRVELQQILWHERIATRYAALCTEIRGHRQARGFT